MEEIMNFELNRKFRENKILEIRENQDPSRTGLKLSIRPGEKFNAYKIPLEFLVYNHLNDRFASQRMEFTSTGIDLSAGDLNTMKMIEKIIWESNIQSNKQTLKDIAKNGQNVHGVITKDGRVIDGNRRLSILRKLFYDTPKEFENTNKMQYKYFEAIVLSDDISDKEMVILETQLQMGEDEKVDYNAIEKYLKINKLAENGVDYKDIYGMIKSIKNVKDAQRMHRVYKLMSEYLSYIEAENKFSLIKRFEDHFINLEKVLYDIELKKYNSDWNPKITDSTDLKMIAFDYIREGHEGKDFRNLVGTQKSKKGAFAHKSVWYDFKNRHTTNVIEINEKLQKFDYKDIKERESIWKKESKRKFVNNLERAKDQVRDIKYVQEPYKLISGALGKMRMVKPEVIKSTYKTDEDYNLINELNELIEISSNLLESINSDKNQT